MVGSRRSKTWAAQSFLVLVLSSKAYDQIDFRMRIVRYVGKERALRFKIKLQGICSPGLLGQPLP